MKRLFTLIITICLFLSFALPSFCDGGLCYVNDEDHHVYASGNGGGRRIALTFDDGPHPEYTDKILDVLAKYGVKATFFVIGENAGYYPEPLARAVFEGHSIGSHTYSHRHIKSLSRAELGEEMKKNAEVLEKFGAKPKLFRPPEGVCDQKVIGLAEENGCDVILWTVDTEDWRSKPAKSIVDNVLSHVHGGEIILMHDYIVGQSHTAEALEVIIPRLLSNGYEFVTVEKLIGREET